MKKLLIITSILEALLGVSLIIFPSLVLKKLFDMEMTAAVSAFSRLTGIVYICFGIACFPAKEISGDIMKSPEVRAMFLYNILAAVYLSYLMFDPVFAGVFLLPAVILHILISFWFVYIIFIRKNNIA